MGCPSELGLLGRLFLTHWSRCCVDVVVVTVVGGTVLTRMEVCGAFVGSFWWDVSFGDKFVISLLAGLHD